MELGIRIRQLRRGRGMTLREVAGAAGVNQTYLSKIENNRPGFVPAAETVRALAAALDADPLELLMLAGKVPPELEHMVASPSGRRFYARSRAITSPAEWDALTELLDGRNGGVRTLPEGGDEAKGLGLGSRET
jgi:transcriptional regulator with XRE-family HTH domain